MVLSLQDTDLLVFLLQGGTQGERKTVTEIRPIADRVVTALGVLMVIGYALVVHHQATLDPHSVWCDPHVVVCEGAR